MKTKIIIICTLLFLFAGKSHAQWVVTDPVHIATSVVNTTKQIVETSTTAKNMINNFKEVQKVYNQGKEYYDHLKSVHDLVKDARKVQKSMLLLGDISEIYVLNFGKMMQDENYSVDELGAIAFGYTRLLEESTAILADLKDVVNINGLSMTDKERMDIIDGVHEQLSHYRNLTQYYTDKNIGVSYLRAKKKNSTERVISLYGSVDEKYW